MEGSGQMQSWTFQTVYKIFFMNGYTLPCFCLPGDAFRAGRPQLISSARGLEEMDLQLGLDRRGVVPCGCSRERKRSFLI
jgi:hypothetical protein